MMKVQEFANKVRSRKPEYSHLDDTDLMQMVAEKKPELLKFVDRDDLALTMKTSRMKKISRARQKAFKSLSGVSRFGIGAGAGLLDQFMGIKQALTPSKGQAYSGMGYNIPGQDPVISTDDEAYEADKAEYKDMSQGDFAAGAGEFAGAMLPTALFPGVTGAKLASKVASPLLKTAIKIGTGGAVGAGYGAFEYVDEDETRMANTAYGALFGAGGVGAGLLLKKVGAKAYNALKGKMKTAKLQDILDLSKKYDIPLTKGDITGEGRMTEKALESIPVVGMGGFRKKGAEKVQTAIKKEAGKLGDDWDETIQKSLQSKAKSGKAQAKVNYNRVEELSGNTSVKPDNAIEMATKHESDIANSVLGNEKNSFTKIKDNLNKKSRTFSDLRKDRSDFGEEAAKAYQSGDAAMGGKYTQLKRAVDADIDNLVKGKKGNISDRDAFAIDEEDYYKYMEAENARFKAESIQEKAQSFGEYSELVKDMSNYVSKSGNKLDKKSGLRIKEHIPESKFGTPSDVVASNLGMDESDFMEMLSNMKKKTKMPKSRSSKTTYDWNEDAVAPDQGVMDAFEKANREYIANVVPYKNKKIRNDIKSDTPDEIFDKYIKKGKGDKAKNFYNLLDDKGKRALRNGFMDNAISGATKDGFTSPAKLAGYLERMAKPGSAIFKGKDLEEMKGFAKIMRHAERYGQINEAPSTGLGLIPFIKGGAMAAAGYGGATSPGATALGVVSVGALTKLMSLMKTKGARLSLASSEIGSKNFEKKLEKIMKQLPKVSAVAGKEIKE